MAKTRSQGLNSSVKEEVCKKELILEQMLHVTKNTPNNNKSKITKNNLSKAKQTAQVKSENAENMDPFSSSSTVRRAMITRHQISKLIGYLENDKMSLSAASKKAGMCIPVASGYYQEYLRDPEHKIPLPKTSLKRKPPGLTQKKIENLINYIIRGKMNVTQAARKAKMVRSTAVKYYTIYKEDPNHKIPVLENSTPRGPRYTQEHIDKLFSYIENEKMTIAEAARKVGMSLGSAHHHYNRRLTVPAPKTPPPLKYLGAQTLSYTTEKVKKLIDYIVQDGMSVTGAALKANIDVHYAKKYYSKYQDDPNHEIPNPRDYSANGHRFCTNEEVARLIGYIVNDGMSIIEASSKANMCSNTGRIYYKQYLADPDRKIPMPESNKKIRPSAYKIPSLDQIKGFFKHVIVDKMNVRQASLKVSVSRGVGCTWYKNYLEEVSGIDTSYSVEKMKKFIQYREKNKLPTVFAARLANLGTANANKYYRRYLNDPKHRIPTVRQKPYTKEQVQELINHVEHDKMSIESAAKKIKMRKRSAILYYDKYQKDPERKIPNPSSNVCKPMHRNPGKYSQIIADIQKENALVKSMKQRQCSNSDLPDVKIKEESVEENTKNNQQQQQ